MVISTCLQNPPFQSTLPLRKVVDSPTSSLISWKQGSDDLWGFDPLYDMGLIKTLYHICSIQYANKIMLLTLACATDPILLQHIHNDSHDLQRTKYIEEFDHSIFSVQTLSLFSFLLYSEMQTFFVLANQTDSNIPMQQGMVRYSLWKWSLILFGLYLSFTYILVHLKYKASDGGNTTSVGT